MLFRSFVHVPRTGGSSIEHVLGICGDDNQGALTPARLDLLFGLVGTKVLQHLTATAIREKLGKKIYDDYFKFAFVRNPYDRVVSEYHVRQRLLPNIKMSFGDFVHKRIAQRHRAGVWKWFRSKAEKALEDQFDTQYEFIFDESGKKLVDFVGKYESLENDFKKIGDRLGLKAQLPVMNRSKHEDYRRYPGGLGGHRIGRNHRSRHYSRHLLRRGPIEYGHLHH